MNSFPICVDGRSWVAKLSAKVIWMSPDEFIVPCDDPRIRPFLVHSYLTKEGLERRKSEGMKLGSARQDHWKGREHLRQRGQKKATVQSAFIRRQQSMAAYRFLIDAIREMRKQDRTLQDVADWLNEKGHRTTRDNEFRAGTVDWIIKLFADHPSSVVTIEGSHPDDAANSGAAPPESA
jgi:hypothetical protein